ncbi:MAG: hypothetical protein KDC82_04785 [Bacteroidetes bacterium]|nr:hypothetical protein [Bacteroidota bacterium]
MLEKLKTYKFQFVAILIGAGLGYAYYANIGCSSGTCAITSSPINSTLYGAMMGYLFLGIFKKDKKQNND